MPTFRPDNVTKTEDPEKFKSYISKLGIASGIEIRSFESLIDALDKRHEFFHKTGCRLSDHGLDRFYFARFSLGEIDNILKKLLSGTTISSDETEKFRTAVMLELCKIEP